MSLKKGFGVYHKTLLLSKELYKYAVQKEDKYLEDKTMELIISLELLSKKDELEVNKNNIDKEEILKVQRKVPKWMSRTNQSNYKILNAYMELSNFNEHSISLEELKNHQDVNDKNFVANFNGMKTISEKNHAKVFDENNKMVELWSPVSEFVIALFREYQFRKWVKESGGLTQDYVIENYVKSLSLYIPENLKEYGIEPFYANIFLCTDIKILKKFHKMYLSGGKLKEQEKNKNLPSSLSKYIQFLEDNKEGNTHEKVD